jgi:hypothetical protein
MPTVDLEVSELSLSSLTVKSGEQVTLQADLTNTSDTEAWGGVQFSLDGQTIETRQVTLGAGAETNVSFAAASKISGEHTVGINGLTAKFTVSGTPFNRWIAVGAAAALIFLISFVFNYMRLRKRLTPG